MESKKKINLIIALLALIVFVLSVPSKPSDFGRSERPGFYKVEKYIIFSICYAGTHTDDIYGYLGHGRWDPCGFGILGMTFNFK